MKKYLLFSIIAVCLNTGAFSQFIWNGPTILFSKKASTDPLLEINQDRISDNVWITRAETKGIFNIKQESFYEAKGTSGNSPIDTEWAFGSLEDGIKTLTFTTWAIAANKNPPDLVGKKMVLHLISEDIYLNITFTEWGVSSGNFAYQRSTKLITSSQKKSILELQLYPNPVTDILYLSKSENVSLFDITGNLILKTNASFIDVHLLSNGIYFLKTEDNKVLKFVKM